MTPLGNAVNDFWSPDASASGYGRTPLRGGHALQACQNSGSARQALFFTLALQKECRPGGAFVRSPMRKRRDSKTPKIQTKKSLTALPFGVSWFWSWRNSEILSSAFWVAPEERPVTPKGSPIIARGFNPWSLVPISFIPVWPVWVSSWVYRHHHRPEASPLLPRVSRRGVAGPSCSW